MNNLLTVIVYNPHFKGAHNIRIVTSMTLGEYQALVYSHLENDKKYIVFLDIHNQYHSIRKEHITHLVINEADPE